MMMSYEQYNDWLKRMGDLYRQEMDLMDELSDLGDYGLLSLLADGLRELVSFAEMSRERYGKHEVTTIVLSEQAEKDMAEKLRSILASATDAPEENWDDEE